MYCYLFIPKRAVFMLLPGLFLGKKCESQPAHLGIYTAHNADHTRCRPLRGRIGCCQFRPRAKMFSFHPASSRYHLPLTRTVVLLYNTYKIKMGHRPKIITRAARNLIIYRLDQTENKSKQMSFWQSLLRIFVPANPLLLHVKH